MDQLTEQFSGHVWVIVGIALVCVVLLSIMLLRRRKFHIESMDEMEGHEFEYYCADILRDHGFDEVEVTKGSGDFGIDILAERDGITYAIQCKRYDGPVGVDAVLLTYAGKDYYDRMVGAVMTNQYFTEPALMAAKKLQILLWDRGYIDSMLEE